MDAIVSDLIDHAIAEWHSNLVKQTFLPYKADVIRGMSLSSSLLDDKHIWTDTSNGAFTVGSTYEIAMNRSEQGGSSSNS